MTGDDIPDEDHVLRYARPTDVLDTDVGGLNCSAFQLRRDEEGLSVNWLEYFANLPRIEQVDRVRGLIRLTLSRNGALAELDVGRTRAYVDDAIRFVHDPLDLFTHA